MVKQKLFKSRERHNRDEIVAFFHELADKMEGGEITLQRGPQTAPLEIPEVLGLKVTAKEKDKKRGTRVTLKLTLKWWEGDTEQPTLTLG